MFIENCNLNLGVAAKWFDFMSIFKINNLKGLDNVFIISTIIFQAEKLKKISSFILKKFCKLTFNANITL